MVQKKLLGFIKTGGFYYILGGFYKLSVFIHIFAEMKNNLKKIRDRDVEAKYKKLIQCKGMNIPGMKRESIARFIATSEAERFYITEKMAERYVYGFYKKTLKLSAIKMRMVENLVEIYEKITSEDMKMQKLDVWTKLVNSRAKEFYVGTQTIKNILFRIKK